MTLRTLTSRALGVLLAGLMLLSAAACTEDTPDTPDTEAPAASDTQADTAPETPADTIPETLPESDEETDPAESETDGETETEPAETATPEGYRPAEEVKVISFNLDANESTLGERSERLLPLILTFEPDSIGVQEARGSWNNKLNRGLVAKGYTRVGVDAGGNSNGSSAYFATYIFYKTDKYELLDSGTFWMSKTPDVPSIYDSTVDCNRTCTWALLENKETGFRYVHMNTHLDWMNMEVNKIQVSMIREQIERFEAMGYPVFATGDYNCDEGTASYKEMLKSEVVADSKHVAEKTMDLGTYPSYGQYDVTVEKPIDYVFVTKDMMEVHEYKVIDEKPGGEYVSDHNGLFVHATVKALPATDDEKTVPQFKKNPVTVTPVGSVSVEVSIAQAVSSYGAIASGYKLELVGTDIQPVMAYSGVLTPEAPEVVKSTLGGMIDGQSYTLRVTPVSIFGDEGKSVEVSFTFDAPLPPAEPVAMGKADIFELSVKDGKPVDISPNAMPITVLGSSAIEGEDHIFQMNGNYKVPDIKNHYANLQDGFTLELYFTTGDDISTYMNPVANFHAGGFGIEIEAMSATFVVHFGGTYHKVYTTVVENTTYHFVAVYDKAAGELRLYVNGALQDTLAVSGTMGLPTHAGAEYLCIGADSEANGTGEYPFAGTVHEVRIYGEAATAGNAVWLWEQIRG